MHKLCATCFFDHALRTVKGYWETVEYIHLNPVCRGLVKHPEQWRWSSYSEYAGLDGVEQERQCALRIDRVRLPADQRARISSKEPQTTCWFKRKKRGAP